MEFGPIEVLDKCGGHVMLRSLRVEDKDELVRFQAQGSHDSEFFPWSPGCSGLMEDNAADYIAGFADAEREMLLGVFDEGDLVALAELSGMGDWSFFKHRCAIAPGVLKSHWRRGLGGMLMTTMADIARSVGYEQSEASVDFLNERSYAYCLSLGFEDCGFLRHAEKRPDGTYRDYHRLVKKLLED